MNKDTPPRKRTGPKKGVDWFMVRRAYESDRYSMAEICNSFDLNASSITRHALKEGWVRGGLNAVLTKATEIELTKRVGDKILTPEAVEEAVRNTAEVIKTHRQVSRSGRLLVASLMDQLVIASEERAAIEDEITLETMPDRDPIKRQRMLAAVSLPAHANTLKTLSVAAANFIKLERESFGLDSLKPGEDGGSDEPYDPTKEAATDAYRRMVG